jgi:hypothetical protein
LKESIVDNQNPESTKSQVLVDKTKQSVERLAKAYNPRTWKEKGLLWTAGLLLLTYTIVDRKSVV